MIDAGLDGGSQWELNDSDVPAAANLQIPENATTDKEAKVGRNPYSGVQRPPRKRDGIGPWLEWHRKKNAPAITHISINEWHGLQREHMQRKDPINWPLIESLGEPMGCEAGSAFSSARGSDDIAYVATLIDRGLLECRSVLIGHNCLNHPLAHLDRRFLMTRGASPEHSELKLLAIAWLRSVGADRAASEVPCPYGSADAYSPTLDIAVECGDTAAARALPVVSGDLAALVVIPFGDYDARGYHGVLFRKPARPRPIVEARGEEPTA